MSHIVLIFACILMLNPSNFAIGSKPSTNWFRGTGSDAIKNDMARYKVIEQRTKGRTWPSPPKPSRRKTLSPIDIEDDPSIQDREASRSSIEGSIKLPMYAAADYRLGSYLVDIEFGTPPQMLRMIVDIGSDLTWVKCKDPHSDNFKNERAFEVKKSSTFCPIPCSQKLCYELRMLSTLDICPTVNAPCLYNYSYGEGIINVHTYGSFGLETATMPTTTKVATKMDKFLLGCSETYMGKSDWGDVDGVLALGVNPYGFGVQATNKYGGTFSYCLVDHLSPTNHSSYLIFGEDKIKASTTGFMRYTMMLIDSASPFYWVALKSITVGNIMLDIPNRYWIEGSGGTVLDSGTTLTYFTQDAYRAVIDMLAKYLSKDHPKDPSCKGDGMTGFEYCFNHTAHPLEFSKVPRLDIHFVDGARFTPHVKNFMIETSPDLTCIGLLEAQGGLNIIGNVLQSNYLWEFDTNRFTVGFAPSICQ